MYTLAPNKLSCTNATSPVAPVKSSITVSPTCGINGCEAGGALKFV